MKYLLDSDVLIQAKNRHYGFDICPGFWDWIDSAHTYQRVFSVERVHEEVCAGNDELAKWAQDRHSLFLGPDQSVARALRTVAEWVNASVPAYTTAAVAEFFDAADYYLVAHALAHGFVVVTAEVRADTVNKVKIPNACGALGIRYVDLFTMLRAEGARFVVP